MLFFSRRKGLLIVSTNLSDVYSIVLEWLASSSIATLRYVPVPSCYCLIYTESHSKNLLNFIHKLWSVCLKLGLRWARFDDCHSSYIKHPHLLVKFTESKIKLTVHLTYFTWNSNQEPFIRLTVGHGLSLTRGFHNSINTGWGLHWSYKGCKLLQYAGFFTMFSFAVCKRYCYWRFTGIL